MIVKKDEKVVEIANVRPVQYLGKDLEPRRSDFKKSKIILLNARRVRVDSLGNRISDDQEAYDCIAFERPIEIEVEGTEEGKEKIVQKYLELSEGKPEKQNYYLGYLFEKEDKYVFEESEKFIEKAAKGELEKMKEEESARILAVARRKIKEENDRILAEARRKRAEEEERAKAMKENWERRIAEARANRREEGRD